MRRKEAGYSLDPTKPGTPTGQPSWPEVQEELTARDMLVAGGRALRISLFPASDAQAVD